MRPAERRKITVAQCGPGTVLAALAVAALALTGFSSATAATSVYSSARSTAMGGAFTALARGVNAPRYNPANLGLLSFRARGVELVSVGIGVTNNTFSLSDYNEYTGAVLSTADKQEILDKVPAEGLSVDADVRASALTVALGSFAVSFNGFGSADISLNRDLVKLLLNGNVFADSIEIAGSQAEGVSYATAELSYGFPIHTRGSRQLAVGLTAGYVRGIAVEKLVELEGLAATLATGIEGHGKAVIRTAEGGAGYKLDLGAVLKFNDSYAAGLRLENLLSRIVWNKGCREHSYIFSFDTAAINPFDEDYVTSEDYSVETDNFSTTLPASLNAGFGKTSGRLLWAVDWVQGFRTAPGVSTKPRLAAGAEYSVFSFLPLRAGFMVGGDRNPGLSFGGGLAFSGFYLDLAVVTGTSFTVYSARGANLSISTGLHF